MLWHEEIVKTLPTVYQMLCIWVLKFVDFSLSIFFYSVWGVSSFVFVLFSVSRVHLKLCFGFQGFIFLSLVWIIFWFGVVDHLFGFDLFRFLFLLALLYQMLKFVPFSLQALYFLSAHVLMAYFFSCSLQCSDVLCYMFRKLGILTLTELR